MTELLGKNVTYPNSYSPEVLVFIPRADSRKVIFSDATLPFDGKDVWNAWEFSWLTQRGSPQTGVLRIGYSALSKNIVESKSLKLYLGGFAFTRFEDKNKVIDTISTDLKKHLNTPTFTAEIFSIDHENILPTAPRGYNVDIHELKNPTYDYAPTLLRCGAEVRDELLCSHALRSLCPVTGQPDWATVYILYRGNEIIPESVLAYITSLRNHQGFHESCAELLFSDIWTHCHPSELSIMCCYTRRGGIDITPIRTSIGHQGLLYKRQLRQ